MKRMTFALIALLCLAVFTLPQVAEAKSPPGTTQVNQDYQLNTTDSTAGIAGYQHKTNVNDGSEVDIGARAVTSTPGPLDNYTDHGTAIEAARTTNPQSYSPAVLSPPREDCALTFGRAATNEAPPPDNVAANHYLKRVRDAALQSC